MTVHHVYEALPFRRLWYHEANEAVDYVKFYSRSPDDNDFFLAACPRVPT